MVSSGLVRAKETADLIAPCLPADRLVYADPNPDLNEGRPAQVIPGRPYSNEAVRVDQQRVERAFRDTFRRADPRDDGARHEYEIVVCHGNVIRYMTLRALQLPPEAWLRLCTFNCSVTYVRPTACGGRRGACRCARWATSGTWTRRSSRSACTTAASGEISD